MISIAGEDTLAEKRALACPPPSMPSEATKTVGTNRTEADMMETDAVAERRCWKAIRCRPPSVVSSTADPDRSYSYQDGARAVLRVPLVVGSRDQDKRGMNAQASLEGAIPDWTSPAAARREGILARRSCQHYVAF